MPNELDRVCQDVALQVAEALRVLGVEEVIQALRQDHGTHVLDVEELAVQEAELIEQLEDWLVGRPLIRHLVGLTDHRCEGCQILFCRAALSLLEHAAQDEIDAGQVEGHDNLLFVVDFLEVAHELEDGLEEVPVFASVLAQARRELAQTLMELLAAASRRALLRGVSLRAADQDALVELLDPGLAPTMVMAGCLDDLRGQLGNERALTDQQEGQELKHTVLVSHLLHEDARVEE